MKASRLPNSIGSSDEKSIIAWNVENPMTSLIQGVRNGNISQAFNSQGLGLKPSPSSLQWNSFRKHHLSCSCPAIWEPGTMRGRITEAVGIKTVQILQRSPLLILVLTKCQSSTDVQDQRQETLVQVNQMEGYGSPPSQQKPWELLQLMKERSLFEHMFNCLCQ